MKGLRLLLILLVFLVPLTGLGASIGELDLKNGKVVVHRKGKSFTLAKPGKTSIEQGDKVRTGKFTKAFLYLKAKKDEIQLFSSSFISVDTLSAKDTKIGFPFGKVKFKVNPKAKAGASRRFRVRTVSALIGVKGTEFLVLTDGASTAVATLAGVVELASVAQPDISVDITKGKISKVHKGTPPTKPVVLSAKVKKALMTEKKQPKKATVSEQKKDSKTGSTKKEGSKAKSETKKESKSGESKKEDSKSEKKEETKSEKKDDSKSGDSQKEESKSEDSKQEDTKSEDQPKESQAEGDTMGEADAEDSDTVAEDPGAEADAEAGLDTEADAAVGTEADAGEPDMMMGDAEMMFSDTDTQDTMIDLGFDTDLSGLDAVDAITDMLDGVTADTTTITDTVTDTVNQTEADVLITITR